MKKLALTIMILVFSILSLAALADNVEDAVIGEPYVCDNVTEKLIAYHVEEIGGTNYLYIEIEFVNNGDTPLVFENGGAWVAVTQDDEECMMHFEELPNIYISEPCKPGATAYYINAYKLNSLKKEVVVQLTPTSQVLKKWNERDGKIYYHLDIVNEPKKIADGYEWEDE